MLTKFSRQTQLCLSKSIVEEISKHSENSHLFLLHALEVWKMWEENELWSLWGDMEVPSPIYGHELNSIEPLADENWTWLTCPSSETVACLFLWSCSLVRILLSLWNPSLLCKIVRALQNGNRGFLLLFKLADFSELLLDLFKYSLSERYTSRMKGSCCSFRKSLSLFCGLAVAEAIWVEKLKRLKI